MKKSSDAITLRDVFYVLFKYKVLLTVFTLSCVLVCGVYSYVAYPKYEATAEVLVEFPEQQSSLGMDSLAPAAPRVITTMAHAEIVNSEIELLRSQYIAERVLDALGDQILNPREPVVESLWQRVKQSLKKGVRRITDTMDRLLIRAGLKEDLPPRQKVLLFIAGGLGVEHVKNSNVVRVSFKSVSPDLAAGIVNEAVSQYLTHRLSVRRPSRAYQFLESQRDSFQQRLREAENALHEFKDRWRVASLEEQVSHVLKLSADIQHDTYQTDIEIARLEERVKAIEGSRTKEVSGSVASPVANPSQLMESLTLKITELKLKRIDLAAQYYDDNPLVKAVDEEIANAEAVFQAEEVDAAVSVDITALRAKRERLADLQEASAAELVKLNGLGRQLSQLTRDVGLYEGLYRDYFEKTEESRILEAMDLANISNVRLIEPACAPALPVRTVPFIPQRIFNLLIAFLAGIFVSMSLVALLEMFDHSFKSAEDVQESLGHPVLATISENRRVGRRWNSHIRRSR